jgi:hypothetical protein
MRPGTTEYGLMLCFDRFLMAKIPIGTNEKLLHPDFPLQVSIIFGDRDWVLKVCDNHFSEELAR